MKKARTILAIMLALVMVLSVLPASFADHARKVGKIPERQDRQGQSVQSRTGKKFQTLDERLAKSNELDPEAEVTAIVIFDEPALSENFTAEEIRAKKASDVQQRMSGAHDVFFKNLGFEAKRLYDYTALINGMSLKTAYKNLSLMEKMSGVKKVYVANEFNAPVVQQPTQANANIMTGAAMLHNILYKGDGMVAAVLDTGLNLGHEVFQDYGVLENPAFTEEYVNSVETTVPGKYISEKVPFTYDYYDMDDDVTDYNGHGSHVSGTVAGFALDADGAVKFSGAAPQAQLVFMKIFADQASGTNSGIYMAALEDCFLLGVDTINMSIGAPGGFVYDPELEEEFGNVYKTLDQAGIVVCISAGNEYSMAHNPGNFAGEGYVLAEYADYAEVASPSTYAGNLSIASMENFAYPSYVVSYQDEPLAFVDNCSDGAHGWLDTFGGQTLELVNCGYGNLEEIPDEVAGKLALVSRGDITFSEKNANVAEKGAIGMILYNNEAGTIGMLIDPYYVPAISITQAAGQTILAGLAEDNTITIPTGMVEIENPNAWLMSDFSSWGCTPNLELKPSVTAPGGMIYSSVAGEPDAYEVYSGTSMASPNACGSFTILLQYLKETYPQLSKRQRAELAEDLVESTAMVPYDADDYLYSPRKSGTGLLSVDYAIETPVYVVQPVVNLGDDPDKEGVYTIRYTLVNLSDEEQAYDAFVVGLFDYPASDGTKYYNSLTADYLLDGSGLTVEGDMEAVVPANGTFDGKITLTLDEDYKEIDQIYPNGNFVEGYIAFESATGEGMVIPANAGVLGDANLDGKVTAADAAEILRAVVGLTELSEEAAKMADVDQDGDVTADDAAFLLRAVVGLEELPANIVEDVSYAPEIHLTFMGFYGDWTQGPVLDNIWTNSPSYLMYFAAENVYYPEYAAAGYLPTDIFKPMETNIKPHMTYGLDSYSGNAYTYFATNPVTTMVSDEEIVAAAWEEYFENDQYNNLLHNAISNYNAYSEGVSEYYVDEFYSEPIQLRNARHLIMTVIDAETGEVYYEDDTEWLGKAYFDKDNSVWVPRGSFYWDGIVTNEASEYYGDYLPNGTTCFVLYETMVDYPGAELNLEYAFQLLVDCEGPVITGMEIETLEPDQPDDAEDPEEPEEPEEPKETKLLHVHFADNGSGMSFAEAYYYDLAFNGYNLGWEVGDYTNDFVIDITDVPEEVNFIQLDALDYATNMQEYVLNLKTGEVEEGTFGTVAFAVNKILEGQLGLIVPVEAIVTDVYQDTVYVAALSPESYAEPLGMAVKLADPDQLEVINVGDVYVFAGELDDYYGCPTLANAEITYEEYINEYDDYGDAILLNMLLFGQSFSWYFEEVMPDPVPFTGYIFYFDYEYDNLTVLDVVECGDGTRTITITDGEYVVDVVGVTVGENTFPGDTIYSGLFIPVFDHGVLQFRALLNGEQYCLEFGSEYAE